MNDQIDRLKAALADRYAILRELGSGGMATVYLADDRKHRRQVAVKVLRPELAQALGPDRFLREIEIAARLNHPHILTLIDSGEADGFLYFVMPYLEGNTLRAKLQRDGALPVAEAVRLTRHIVDALAHAHKQGVVHRDVKPDNVMLIEGHAVVTDFGVAKALSAATGRHEVTTTGVTLGTPTYMAPEQAAADPNIDHRADIYAVGVMAYEMLVGQPPFAGETAQEILSAHVVRPAPPIADRRDGLPPALADLVMRCLKKKPADRWHTAEELRAALDRIATPSEGSLSVRHVATTGRGVPWPRWGAAGALGVAALAAFVLWPRGADDGGEAAGISESVVAVLPFAVQGSDEVAYLGDGMVNLLSTKLDGAGDLRSVDSRALLGYIAREGRGSDPREPSSIARRFGAGVYVIGDVVEAGGRLQISAALYRSETDSGPIGRANVEGEANDVFGLVDRIAADLLGSLGSLGGPGTRVRQLASVSTSSLPALKAYLECESLFRLGHFQPAVASCQRAIAEDSAFALAYYRLSVAAELGTISDLAQSAAEEANSRSSRLAQRDRRMVEALVAWRRGEHSQAERLYRSLVGTYPDDIEALHQLGEVVFHANPLHGRAFTAAREPFERLLSYEPNHAVALVHLARIASVEQRLPAMDSLVQRYVELNPEGDRQLEMLALQAYARRDAVLQDEVNRRLERASDVTLGLAVWDVVNWTDDIEGAARVAGILAAPSRSNEERSVGLAWLAHISLAQGKWREAREHLDAIEPLSPAMALEYRALLSSLPFVPTPPDTLRALRHALMALDPGMIPRSTNPSVFFSLKSWGHGVLRRYLLGLVSARLGDVAAAERSAAQLEALRLPLAAGTFAADLAGGVRAQLAVVQGDTAGALTVLDGIERRVWYLDASSSAVHSQVLERFTRAEVLHALGQDDEALGWYEHLTELVAYEVVYRPWANLRRAEIYEAQGDTARAREHYQRFIDLWQNADPELQSWLELAESGLARLESGG